MPRNLSEEAQYKIDPSRYEDGCYPCADVTVTAKHDNGNKEVVDISVLDRKSLDRFLRSRTIELPIDIIKKQLGHKTGPVED